MSAIVQVTPGAPVPGAQPSAPLLCATDGRAQELVIPDRRRTLYPAIRLWRAELRAGAGGQREADPATWISDDLLQAAILELDAAALAELGAQDDARQLVRRARETFLQIQDEGGPWRDSDYRRALHERAVAGLGLEAAIALALKERPRRRQVQ